MNLNHLKNRELHEKLKLLLSEENRLTHDVLMHIMEVDRRKLFLEMAYPNLFDYLTKGIGFTAASAQRRIDAARLMRQIPEVADKISMGSLNLVQIGRFQKAIRYIGKKRSLKVSLDDKKRLLDKIQNKTLKETDLLIAKNFDLPVFYKEKKTLQSDESIRLELTFSKEEMERLDEAKAILSHALSEGNFKDMILHMADRVIKQRRNTDSKNNQKTVSKIGDRVTDVSDKAASRNQIQSGISSSIRRQTFQRDMSCQYQDPLTNKVCGSKYFLEIDHIKPRWVGGSHDAQNLRVLCSAHNKFRYFIGR